MNDEKLNMSVRKFLKNVGITSQRNIEEKVKIKVNAGEAKNLKKIKIKAIISSDEINLNETIEGEIEI